MNKMGDGWMFHFKLFLFTRPLKLLFKFDPKNASSLPMLTTFFSQYMSHFIILVNSSLEVSVRTTRDVVLHHLNADYATVL